MQFDVSFDTSSPNLAGLTGAEQQAILDVANAAATVWSWYLTAANITLNLLIKVDDSLFSGNTLGEGGPTVFYTNGATFNGKTVYVADTTVELQGGPRPSGSPADLNIDLTTNSIRNLLYFKTDEYGAVPSGRADALSVFLHEIGHGLGFSSAADDSSFPGVTLYDTFVQNGTFTGSNAEAAYQALVGSLTPLPLQPGSLSHLSETGPLGSDLMSPIFNTGTNVGISAVDLGILQDIGVPIRLATSGDDVLRAVANIDLHMGAGNDTGYAIAIGSTIYGEAGNDLLIGGAGTDHLNGGDGDDILVGGGASDQLDGGAGNDIARYSGLASDYQITLLTRTSVYISDLRPGAPDGTDLLNNIEQVQWGDGSIANLPVDRPPIVTTSNLNAYRGQVISLSSLFSVSDADGDAMTQYQLWDATRDPNSGYFVIGGRVQSAGTLINLYPIDLASSYYVAGSVGDTLQIRAYDGFAWSAGDSAAWSPFTVTVTDAPPIVTTANVSKPVNTVVPLSSLFSVTDPDGDGITRYEFWAGSSDPNSGHFVVNGVAQPVRTVIDITAAQVAQTSFVVGTVSDSLQIRAFDGTAWSAPDNAAWSPFTVSVTTPPPVVTVANVTLPAKTTIALSSLFSATDPAGLPITLYQIYETNQPNTSPDSRNFSIPDSGDPSSGYLLINGVVQTPFDSSIYVTPAQLSQVSFATGAALGDYLAIRAFDGVNWSSSDILTTPGFTIMISGTPNHRPELTMGNLAWNGVYGALPGLSAQRNQTLPTGAFSFAYDADGDPITVYEVENTNTDASGGHFVVNGVVQPAGTVLDLTPTQWAQTVFVTGTGSDDIKMRVFDGKDWSATPFPPYRWVPGDIAPGEVVVHVPNNAPVLRTSNISKGHGQSIALSSLFSYSDADGDTLEKYQLLDTTTDPNSGHFVINGVVQAAGTVINVSDAQLLQTSFVTGKVSDTLQIRAFDGTDWSAADNASWAPFTISVPNAAPVVTTANITRSHFQTLALSSLFSASDADGDSMTRYQLWDGTRDPNSGHFVINGVTQAAGTVIDITATNLANTVFVTGTVSDSLQIRAFDGLSWSAGDNANWSPFTIAVANQLPVVTTSTVSAARVQTLALSSLFSVTDADGDAMTKYQLWDATRDAASGHFVISGVAQAASTVITINASDLASTSFVTGSVGDNLQIRAFDGIAWSAADNASWASFNVSVPEHAPVVTANNVSTSHLQTIPLSSLFSVTDADGDAMTQYQLWDATRDPASGHFVVGGVAQAAGAVITISAADLANTSFVTGSVGDNLQMRAFDGITWSAADNGAWSPFTVTVPANRAPVVTTANITEPHLQAVPLSSLFSVSDADNDSMTRYQLWDGTSDPNSGHFTVGGAVQAANTLADISAAQLSQTFFVAGTVGDNLQIRAFDGIAWSAGDTASWSPFHIAVS